VDFDYVSVLEYELPHAFSDTITFTGTFDVQSLELIHNLQESTVFSTLIVRDTLYEPTKNTATATNVTFHSQQSFDEHSLWFFPGHLSVHSQLYLHPSKFTAQTLKFVDGGSLEFQAREPLTVPAPPASISVEADIAPGEGVLDLLLRQHGDRYGEFSHPWGYAGSVDAYRIVCGSEAVVFDNCEEWRARVAGVAFRTPAGYALRGGLRCETSTRGRFAILRKPGEALEDAWRNVDPWNQTCLVWSGGWTGGDPLSAHAVLGKVEEAGLSGGAVAGIVVGTIAFVAVVAVAVGMLVLGKACCAGQQYSVGEHP
jgi:hypothetical protein